MPINTHFQEDKREAPIHGDILEAIFSHVPLIHLVPARHVSNAWKRAVSSSLRHVNPVEPWLTVHIQSNRALHVTNTFAYDPRSRAWLQIHAPHTHHSSPLRASHSSLVYTLSPTEFTFSLDPLHLTWHHAHAPRVWRTDPVVARVGTSIVVAGGVCDFEDDPLAVEMYDTESRAWVMCPSMPAILKDSTASTWLSVAVAGEKMYVTEKSSGMTCSFDCNTTTWQGPYNLRPHESVVGCVTGTIQRRLMVLGLIGDAENVKGVKLWEVKGESEVGLWCEEVGEMPKEMMLKLMGEDGCFGVVGSIVVNWIGDFVYVQNPMQVENMIVCEVVGGGARGGWKWSTVKNLVVNDATRMGRMLFSGGDVGVHDLQTALSANCRFVLKDIMCLRF
ncbi:F-box/kelch-repeat protein At1g23390-like [Abrus precatorius]|uniref:F-box/kelch-repeat protein At1g23390-like n=1 Tax=Abrus precatorius TaxID=3816 RepID=A0A8B8KUP3_ABRPR|nr:F-box/kelch-repeat protein At1g23390-like [Abrus precatorius]